MCITGKTAGAYGGIRSPAFPSPVANMMASTQNDPIVKCQRCPYKGPLISFPRKLNLQHSKTCQQCTEKRRIKARAQDKPSQSLPTLSMKVLVSLLEANKENAFELHAYVSLTTEDTPASVESARELALFVANKIRQVTGYRFKCVIVNTAELTLTSGFPAIKRRKQVVRHTESWPSHSTALS